MTARGINPEFLIDGVWDSRGRRPESPLDHDSPPASSRDGHIAELRARLFHPEHFEKRLQRLSDLGLNDAELARAIPNGHARTVRRWRVGGIPEARGAVDDLSAMVSFLLADGTYDERGAIEWLRARNPRLDFARPLDLLGKGGFDAVLEAAERTLGEASPHAGIAARRRASPPR